MKTLSKVEVFHQIESNYSFEKKAENLYHKHLTI
jgi:hypothetical protein